MAEKKGFFRKIFSFGSDSEAERTPEASELPRASDTEVARPDAVDPEARPVAAAPANADTEAGADPDDGGGITPLPSRADAQSHEPPPVPQSGEAQKKTLKS